MKNRDIGILSYLAIAAFMLYWAAVFILAMPPNRVKETIRYRAPFFKNSFGITWTLFTPLSPFDDRLYFVVKEIAGSAKPDTIEVLEDIALQKQQHAPFNQEENILDHLVNNNVRNIKLDVWNNKKKPSCSLPCASDSLYISDAIAAAAHKKNYIAHLNTLTNYCRIVLRQRKINVVNKEVKIMITEKQMRPFKQMDDDKFIPTETLVFETPYNRLIP